MKRYTIQAVLSASIEAESADDAHDKFWRHVAAAPDLVSYDVPDDQVDEEKYDAEWLPLSLREACTRHYFGERPGFDIPRRLYAPIDGVLFATDGACSLRCPEGFTPPDAPLVRMLPAPHTRIDSGAATPITTRELGEPHQDGQPAHRAVGARPWTIERFDERVFVDRRYVDLIEDAFGQDVVWKVSEEATQAVYAVSSGVLVAVVMPVMPIGEGADLEWRPLRAPDVAPGDHPDAGAVVT